MSTKKLQIFLKNFAVPKKFGEEGVKYGRLQGWIPAFAGMRTKMGFSAPGLRGPAVEMRGDCA